MRGSPLVQRLNPWETHPVRLAPTSLPFCITHILFQRSVPLQMYIVLWTILILLLNTFNVF